MAALIIIFWAITIIAFAAILRGYVLSVLWSWFVIPTFSLPPLSIPVAIGIGLILAFTTHQTSIKKEDKSAGERFADAIINPLMLLLIGWIVTLFM